MPQITFIDSSGTRKTVTATEGQTILDIAHHAGIDEIEGSCGGSMACATCHVIVDDKDFAKLPPRHPDEDSMLSLADGLRPTSRLGCQLVMKEDWDGLTLYLPDKA